MNVKVEGIRLEQVDGFCALENIIRKEKPHSIWVVKQSFCLALVFNNFSNILPLKLVYDRWSERLRKIFIFQDFKTEWNSYRFVWHSNMTVVTFQWKIAMPLLSLDAWQREIYYNKFRGLFKRVVYIKVVLFSDFSSSDLPQMI